MTNKVSIPKLATGIPGLDDVLGGGLPELSFNIIAGAPGCGKTTLAHQFMFSNAGPKRKAIYFTVYGEPSVKMLRYQQQFSFFDFEKIGEAIRFIHLGEALLSAGSSGVLDEIERELAASEPAIVIVDSFRAVARIADVTTQGMDLERFVQMLALTLTSYEATTLLVGEYPEHETDRNPVFTVADGIVWLAQNVVQNSVIRQLRIVKMRGGEQIPGLHTVKLTTDGLRVFPRLLKPSRSEFLPLAPVLKKIGIAEMDAMLGGGLPSGFSLAIVGPPGAGKTTLVTHFIAEGLNAGEPAVIAVFERNTEDYLRVNQSANKLRQSIDKGTLKVVPLSRLDLTVDEALDLVLQAVEETKAHWLVIDSLVDFELTVAPAYRENFRECVNRMIHDIARRGVTVVTIGEATELFNELTLSTRCISIAADGIILQRYLEIEGHLRKVMTVIKMRGQQHSNESREYFITSDGIVIGDVLSLAHAKPC